MIVSVANKISTAQQGLTLPVPQSSANKPPFAQLFCFSSIQITAKFGEVETAWVCGAV
jgi:hypothetical protein